MARLRIVEAGKGAGRVVELTGAELLVGRDDACQVVLSDRALSRRHARFVPAGGGWRVLDQQSGNGTFVNGRRVREATLKDGDQLLLGGVRVLFEDPPPVAGPTVPAPPRIPPPPPRPGRARSRSPLPAILAGLLLALVLLAVAGHLAWRRWGAPGPSPSPAAAVPGLASESGLPPLDARSAIDAGDVRRLEELLAGGLDPNETGDDGLTLLHRAAWAGGADAARLLVAKGADLSRRDPLGLTAAGRALAEGRCTAALELLPKAAGSQGDAERTLLHRAAEGGCAAAATELVTRGAVADAVDAAGLTPLHLAALSGSGAVAAALLTGGAAVAKATPSGRTTLHLAALAGRVEVVKVLLEKGADPNERDAGGHAPLHLAAAGGDARTVSALLAAKADATAAGPGGTALDVALAAGALDIAELLAPPDR